MSQKTFGTKASGTTQGYNGRLWLKEAEDPKMKSTFYFEAKENKK